MSKAPRIITKSGIYHVNEQTRFSADISKVFAPADGSLQFSFIGYVADWLTLDAKRGVVSGITPHTTYDKIFKFSVIARNFFGYVNQHFILKVLCTNAMDTTMPPSLTNTLSLKREFYGYHHLSEYTPELLEYVYWYYQQPEYQKSFHETFKEFAKNHDMPINSEYVSFETFKKVLETINPQIQKEIRKRISGDNLLLTEKISNANLRNLFRQGSAPQGVIAIPIWNHWGYPDLYDWGTHNPIDNVMDMASDQIRRLKASNLEQQAKLNANENYQSAPVPTMTLTPKKK